MKILSILAVLFLISCSSAKDKTLTAQMAELNVRTTLLVSSQGVDKYALWSRNSDQIAFNNMGEWKKLNLNKIKIVKAKWRGHVIGAHQMGDEMEISQAEQNQFRANTKTGERKIIASNGDMFELNLSQFSTSFVMTRQGQRPMVLWQSTLDNCHNFSLSPNEVYLTYLCELNGLFVMKIK